MPPGWALWAIAAAFLAVGEVLTPGLFFLGPLALAAVAAAVVAGLVSGAFAALAAFVVAAAAGVLVLRPLARRHIRVPRSIRTGTAALVGTKAVVLSRVDGTGGLVKIGGEQWSARSYNESDVIDAGEQVEVAQIEGATALVLR